MCYPYLYYTKSAVTGQKRWFDFPTSTLVFLPIAILDYLDRVLVTSSMGLVSASLVGMIRGLVPPIAGVFSHMMFGTSFSQWKILAMTMSIFGVSLGCFV